MTLAHFVEPLALFRIEERNNFFMRLIHGLAHALAGFGANRFHALIHLVENGRDLFVLFRREL